MKEGHLNILEIFGPALFYFFILCIEVSWLHVYMYITCVLGVPWSSEERVFYPGTGDRGGVNNHVSAGNHPGLLKDLLTTERSLQSLRTLSG